MSEEEIIKYKKDCDLLELTDEELINEAKATLINSMNLEDEGFRRVEKVALVGISTLLDLYNKEKEKNKELMQEYHKRVQEKIDLQNEIEDCISKDKIREILNIYNTSKSEFATLPNGKEIILSDNGPLAEYLEELLGE